MEGVRPQRYAAGTHPFGVPDSSGESSILFCKHTSMHSMYAHQQSRSLARIKRTRAAAQMASDAATSR